MKKYFIVVVFFALLLSGCGAVQLVQSAVNARAAYQGYEAYSMMKTIKDKTPVFKSYQIVFVSVDVQPRKAGTAEVNAAMMDVYSRSINDMAKELGLAISCKPYSQAEVEAASDALIIQVAEVKTSKVGAIMSGENIHAKVTYIDKKSARALVEEEYNPLKNYEAMIGIMSSSAMVKMMNNGVKESASDAEKKQWQDTVMKFVKEGSKKYPIVTSEEKKVLAKG